jgi:hypothetical protein
MTTHRTGLLIVRAWVEPGSAAPLRARIQVTDDLSDGIQTVFLTQSDAVELLVAQWLREVLEPR